MQGRSALHYAAALKDNTYIYKTLINHGAETSLRDLAGNTPGHYAKNRRELNKEKLMDFLHSSPTAVLPREKSRTQKKINQGEVLDIIDEKHLKRYFVRNKNLKH